MDLYNELGYLILGSRLRRISETFLAEIGAVYQQQDIEFEVSWFPIFYLLAQHQQLSQRALSEKIEVSYAAISQLIKLLKKKGLVTTAVSQADGRMQLVSLSPKGQKLLEQIKPLWEAMRRTMAARVAAVPGAENILPAIGSLEQALEGPGLAGDILANFQSHNNEPAI